MELVSVKVVKLADSYFAVSTYVDGSERWSSAYSRKERANAVAEAIAAASPYGVDCEVL